MSQFYLIFYSYFIFLPIFHGVLSLRCRTGNQQSDDQLQKIMQVCRRRYLGYDRNNGGRDYYRDTDSQESSSSSDSDSDEDIFDNKFLSGGGYNRGYSNNNNNMNNNNNRNMGGSRSGTMMHRSYGSGRSGSYSMNNNNSRSSYLDSQGSSSNQRRNNGNGGRGGMQSYDNRNSYSNNNMNNNRNYNNNNYDDMNSNNEGERERACVIQCFFSELNMVDQRGFPERSAVIGLMIQNIQDPELRDFVEESVVECYHHLSNMGRLEKCQFSQNLLSCLAEKGSEKCDDWEDN